MSGELIARLEAAEAGSRELDRDIAVLLDGFFLAPPDAFGEVGYCVIRDGVTVMPGGEADMLIPAYTTSLDAALALAERVLSGWSWSIAGPREPVAGTDDGRPSVALHAATHVRLVIGTAATPALAACIAILRTRNHEVITSENNQTLENGK